MKPGKILSAFKHLNPGGEVRRPLHAVTVPAVEPVTEAQLQTDAAALRQITEGLQELEKRVEKSEIPITAEQRGYLTPEEDDRVRTALLAYRNYRHALYEILLRLEHYPGLKPPQLRLRAFLVAYVAAVTLYAKSLKLNALANRSRLVRGKLNEPEPKFDLEAGFFDEVMDAYCSLRNYGSALRAMWFWTTRRRAIRHLARSEPAPWAWLEQAVVTQRKSLSTALNRVLRSKLREGWRSFWLTAFKPVDRASYRVRARMGGRFAGFWLQPGLHRPLDGATLTRLQSCLKPGDVLLTRSEGKLTASILPGFWAHAAIYLGTRLEMEALINKPSPPLEPDEGLGYVIEAVSPRVRIVSLRTCLDADHVLVLRPRLTSDRLRAALQEARCHLNKEYDFEFDFNLSNRLVCTGLVYRTYQGLDGIGFQLIKRLGNFTLTGDDVVAQSLGMHSNGTACLPPALLVLRQPSAWRFTDSAEDIRRVLVRIAQGWRPLG